MGRLNLILKPNRELNSLIFPLLGEREGVYRGVGTREYVLMIYQVHLGFQNISRLQQAAAWIYIFIF